MLNAGVFLREYIANRWVAFTPSIRFRRWFYRTVLHIRMDNTVNVQMGCYIYVGRGELSIGSRTVINRGCVLDRRGGLKIGACVSISPEACLYSAGHAPQSPGFDNLFGAVEIGDHAWIGTRAMIMPRVVVGEGAVVLPGAVVTRSVAPYTIVGGVPAQPVGVRNGPMSYDPSWFPKFQ